jgi:hypothetical protein
MSDGQSVDAILAGKPVVYEGAQEAAEKPQAEPDHKPEREAEPLPEAASDNDNHDDAHANNANDADDKADSDDNFDEYGNERKSKTYSQDELDAAVNKAVRERLERFKRNNPEAASKQEVEQAAEGFEYNENADGDWQQQLEQFIFKALDKKTHVDQQKQYQQKEQQRLQEFEHKFASGMQKFDDFDGVVGGQPINDNMVFASRDMQNPAAFWYAAAKSHPQELNRIANLDDPIAQRNEVIRLEAKMKSHRRQSNAPEPASITPETGRTVGDRSVDALIVAHAKDKAKQRGRM